MPRAQVALERVGPRVVEEYEAPQRGCDSEPPARLTRAERGLSREAAAHRLSDTLVGRVGDCGEVGLSTAEAVVEVE
eukprot:6168355-Prymnesium_polylepis.1